MVITNYWNTRGKVTTIISRAIAPFTNNTSLRKHTELGVNEWTLALCCSVDAVRSSRDACSECYLLLISHCLLSTVAERKRRVLPLLWANRRGRIISTIVAPARISEPSESSFFVGVDASATASPTLIKRTQSARRHDWLRVAITARAMRLKQKYPNYVNAAPSLRYCVSLCLSILGVRDTSRAATFNFMKSFLSIWLQARVVCSRNSDA